jgi:hypothetical protein
LRSWPSISERNGLEAPGRGLRGRARWLQTKRDRSKKRHLGALRADRPTPSGPYTTQPSHQRSPAAVQFPTEQPAQTNLRGGEARRPRWRGERCTWLTSEVLKRRSKGRKGGIRGILNPGKSGGSPSKHTHTAMPLVSGRSNAGTPKLLRCIAVAMLGLT